MPTWTNDPDDPDRHLIVISAPRRNHPKYKWHFDALIDFDIRLAQAIIGHDNVIVLASRNEMPYLRGKLPDDVLLEANLRDIWIRDFAPVLTTKMVQFRYRPRYLKRWEAEEASSSFASFCRRYGLKFEQSKLVLDGGNLVSNLKDMAVVTERVLRDNPEWTRAEIVEELKEKLALEHVAIIPEEPGDVTGHADGMVMWLEDRVLACEVTGPLLRGRVDAIVTAVLPGVTLHCASREDLPEPMQRRRRVASAYGCSVNAVVTNSYLYMPVYHGPSHPQLNGAGHTHSLRTLMATPADAIADLGGTVRCATWSIGAHMAAALIASARTVDRSDARIARTQTRS